MMLAALRRSRFLAALLVSASPAGLGTALPVAHPCPVDAPWLAHHQAASGVAGHHGHHGPSQQVPSGEHTCTCIGSCIGTAAPPGPVGQVVARVSIAPSLTWSSRDASLSLAPLASLLPFSTAPPAA